MSRSIASTSFGTNLKLVMSSKLRTEKKHHYRQIQTQPFVRMAKQDEFDEEIKKDTLQTLESKGA